MPCYNGERFLAEAIESVLTQTHPATEIIVVDDASTDGSKAIVERYPQVKYLPLAVNQGAAAARNHGIASSTGEYIVILDCDDRLLPNAIKIGVNTLKAHPDWMFTFGTCRLIDENGVPTQTGRKILEQPIQGSVYMTLLRGTCLNPPGRHIFRRVLFETIGYFDLTLKVAEDYDLYLRAAAASPGKSHNQPVVEYRQHGKTLSETTHSFRHLVDTLTVFAKQKPLVQQNPKTASAHREGIRQWCRLYSPYLVYDVIRALKKFRLQEAVLALYLTLRYHPQGVPRYALEQVGKLTDGLPFALMRRRF
ncbi:glycosyltransferase [Phormidium tenue FACHB-886]|nr:glycosyltransferase [Phormidium tenue FACHB-886]